MKLENADLKTLGRAAKVTIDKENTTIIEGKELQRHSRKNFSNQKQIDDTTSEYDRENYKNALLN